MIRREHYAEGQLVWLSERVCVNPKIALDRREAGKSVALSLTGSITPAMLMAMVLSAFILWACAWSAVASPEMAHAEQVKHPIPSLTKEVSLDQEKYTDQITARAGDRVHYRLTLTMPEHVEDMKTVVYTVDDMPDSAIAVDAKSVSAVIARAGGATKVQLTPRATFASGKLSVSLGDLKLQYPNLSSGDRVIVRYDAQLSPSAPAGRHPNVAKLIYDLGDGERQTAEVMALVMVPDAPGGGSQVVKTGDSLASVSLLCLAISTASGLGLSYALRRRSR